MSSAQPVPARGHSAALAHPLKASHRPDRVIVRFKDEVPLAKREALHRQVETKPRKLLRELHRLEVRELAGKRDVAAAIAAYEASGLVEYAEPDYVVKSSLTPNDPLYAAGYLWQHENVGQSGGVNDADIDATAGWNVRTASGAVVAVIDTGVRYTHEDLQANMWRNPGEIAGNGLDDDQNGYVDDVHGINAITGSGNPADDAGHGTHVAGIMGATGHNGRGLVGVAWGVKLLAAKILAADGLGYASDAIEAIDYARRHGATVLNLSWGGPAFSQALFDALNRCRTAGIVILAAAGNEAANNDSVSSYPANYALDNILAVAATTRHDTLASYSNFGGNTVHLAAPGDEIASTYHTADNAYVLMSGTSMATPLAAGMVALLRAHYPNETHQQLIARTLKAVDPLPALAGKTRTGGRINLAKALEPGVAEPPPAAPGSLVATAASATSVGLTWTDVATTETGYEIERASGGAAFARIATTAANAASYSDTTVAGGTAYSYRVRALSATGASAYSNTATVSTPAVAPPPSPTPGWQNQDIGAVAAAGKTVVNGGSHTLTASGEDIWGTADEFHYASQSLSGDGQIIARVTALDNTDGWAKAGVMMRASHAANAPNVFLTVNPSFVVLLQHRAAAGGNTAASSAQYRWPPTWLKLVRAGNVFSGFLSPDGVNWIAVSNATVTMPSTIQVGLAVTSHRDGTLCNATFDQVSLSGGTATTPAPVTLAAPSGLQAQVQSASAVSLSWQDNTSTETGFQLERSTDGVTFSQVRTAGANVTSLQDDGLAAATTYHYRIRAVNTESSSPYSNIVAVTTAAAPAPTPPPDGAAWSSGDIGHVGVAGTTPILQGSSVTLVGAGEDIWNGADGFRYAWKTLAGNGQIVARVDSLENTHGWAKAGVMIRENTAPNSRHAFVYLTPNSGAGLHTRAATGGTTANFAGPWWVSAPYWVKLARNGDTLTGYTSADGVTWTLVSSQTVPMASTVTIGVAVTSHTTSRTNTARFTNVQITAQ